MNYTVYQLINPHTQDIFYVGMTSCPYFRFNKHKNGNVPTTKSYILALKGEVIIEELKALSSKTEALQFEEQITNNLLNNGIILLNQKIGNKSTDQFRDKMKLSHKNRPPISEETRAKMSKSQSGSRGRKFPNRKSPGPMSEEQKKLISEKVKETKRLKKLSRIT